MAGSTTTAYDAALKEIYLGEIREQINSRTRVLNEFTKGARDQYEWEGRQAIVALHSGRSNAVKAISEGGSLPSAGNQAFGKLTIPMRFWEGRIQLTTQVMKASRSNKGSFARAMEREKNGIVADVSRQRNRALFGFGGGTLALTNGGGAGTSQAVDTPGGVSGSVNGSRFLKAGMVVAFSDFTTPATIDAVRTISSITDSNTIVLTATATPDDNSRITLGTTAGSVTQGSIDIEPVGLLGIVDSTTYLSTIHGLDRSAAAGAYFRSGVNTSTGLLSTDLIQRLIDNQEEISGEVIDTFYAHYSVRREYLKLMEADRRYTADMLRRPDAGTDAAKPQNDLTYGGFPIKIDKDAPYGTLFGLSKSHLFWIPEVEGEWMDEDGAILRRVADQEAFEATYRVWENFYSDQGNAHFRADGITATVTAGVYAD